ncbi:uncharacterized protein PRCAT00000472001 [Priceomyces carsonii]|uniref:uncharacterized protein n=1 Tax=Priceomyces carsonii TaxID=28549 RepID=UPI002ED9CE58|nr:unnamed protein product [Priceomyces carsonii]
MKYIPVQSFVESSFFTKLSELKLDKFKLDASETNLTCFMTHPKKLNKFNDVPTIILDHSSFEAHDTQDPTNIYLDGTLLNVNTIDEFKSLDKQKLLQRGGQAIYDKITSNDLDFKTFNKFFVLAFSDLKKYKFYYWVAFPTFLSPWELVKKVDNVDLHLEESIQDQLDTTFQQFYQLQSQNLVPLNCIGNHRSGTFVFIDSCLNPKQLPSAQLKNYLYFLAFKGYTELDIIVYRKNNLSFLLKLTLSKGFDRDTLPKITGWERTNKGTMGPKMANLGSLIDPHQLAEQAVDLNIKLMKWRIAPDLDLAAIKSQKILLLGAGTLGSYVSRALMGWGVRKITFVDNGRISYSNPVRQPLFNFRDCFSDEGRGELKAIRAAKAVGEVFPGVISNGYNLEVPMIGHPATEGLEKSFKLLEQLFDEHDAIFLLMDSRESRWLPTLMGLAKNKTVINAALGFDGFLVMRHGTLRQHERLGCYYCNDVVAPNDSLSDRTLDQMCTVTRPGVALMASALAVELFISLIQHPDKDRAPVTEGKLGLVPHQIRGFLHNFHQTLLLAPNYKHCSACSQPVLEHFENEGWKFVEKCLNDSTYLEGICGLAEVQKEAELASEALLRDLELSDDEDQEWLD